MPSPAFHVRSRWAQQISRARSGRRIWRLSKTRCPPSNRGRSVAFKRRNVFAKFPFSSCFFPLEFPGVVCWRSRNRMLYSFEDYSLDVTRQELRRGAAVVAVEPQVLDLLHYLIRNRERLVSKDDLIAHVWNGR